MFLRPLALLAAVAGVAFASTAQADERAQKPSPSFSVALDVVNVTVTVRDHDGKLVTDLEPGDFILLEDGRPQRIQVFGRAHDPGSDQTMALDLGLLMDTSQSMLKVLKLSQEAATRFLDTIPRARNLVTIFFDQDIRISRYDSEHQQGLYNRINTLTGGGNTALYDAITVYLSRIVDTRGRKVMVLFSDGEDSISTVSFSEVLQMVRSSPVTIYPIAFRNFRPGSSADLRSLSILRQLAEMSGGQVFMPGSFRDLGGIYNQILAELKGQYVLGFVSDNPVADGRYRKLKVEVRGRDDLNVRCRKGYMAPAPPEPEPGH